jgi:hypothetical protein
MSVQTFKPMSEKQQSLIKKLSGEKNVPVAGKTDAEAWLIARWEDSLSGKDVAMSEASKVIDWMFTLPKVTVTAAPAATSSEPLTPGLYEAPNGDVIRLQKTRDGQRMYAKVLVEKGTVNRINLDGEIVHFEWTYAPGLAKFLTPAMKLSAEAAGHFGLKTGACLWCGRKLVDADSLKFGIGPVCRKALA